MVTAVRTAWVTPRRAAAEATAWAATGVRTHTKTERTVLLLSGEKKNTKTLDQYVVLPELSCWKLTENMPSPAAASTVEVFSRRSSAAVENGGTE